MGAKWFSLDFDNSRQVKITTDEKTKDIRLYLNGLKFSYDRKVGNYVGCGVDAAHSFMSWFNPHIDRNTIKKHIKVTEWVSDVWNGLKLWLDNHNYYFTTPREMQDGLEALINLETKAVSPKIKRYKKGTDIKVIEHFTSHLEQGMPVVTLIHSGGHWVTVVGINIHYKDDNHTIIDVNKTTVTYIDLTTGATLEKYYLTLDILGWENSPRRKRADFMSYHSFHEGTLLSLNEKPHLNESKEYSTYRVEINTGDVIYSGTDAAVYITLFGDNWQSKKVLVDTILDDNEENTTTTIGIIAPDYSGKINKVLLEHNNQKSGAGWFINKVKITNVFANRIDFFTANEWLSDTNKYHHPSVLLLNDEDRINYNVSIKTGNVKNGGTNANVYIKLFSKKGETRLQRLDVSGFNDFERGSKGIYTVRADNDLGKITKVCIEHDNEGYKPGWYLEKISVIKHGGRKSNFTANQWLSHANTKISPRICLLEDNTKTAYKVTIKTENVPYAGTDAKVYINIYGENGSTGYKRLDTQNFNDFETGSMKEYIIYSDHDLGSIHSIFIKHDNSNDKAGWLLDKVTITANNKAYSFTANTWLANKDRHTEPNIMIYEDKHRYKYNVTIKTSKAKGAGTDSNIYLQLFGENGKMTFNTHIDDKHVDDFEKGSEMTYTIYSNHDLGEIYKIRLESDKRGKGYDWKVQSVVVNNKYRFNNGGWLGKYGLLNLYN